MNKKYILFALIMILMAVSFANAALTEEEKISQLIASVKNAPEGTLFIRNGRAYSAADAADHLQTKYNRTKNRVKTARDFIEYLATKSSISGKDYQIQFPDGTTVPSNVFFTDELVKIEQQ